MAQLFFSYSDGLGVHLNGRRLFIGTTSKTLALILAITDKAFGLHVTP